MERTWYIFTAENLTHVHFCFIVFTGVNKDKLRGFALEMEKDLRGVALGNLEKQIDNAVNKTAGQGIFQKQL